jgi:hypothetical protein
MANLTASIFIKPTVAFNRGYTFVFGSWVCTADGVGSFLCRLTMPPNPKTGLVTLPEAVTGDLAGKFGKISLYNQHADFELGSDSNSNSTSPWAIACELAIEPSCADSPLHGTSHTASASLAGPMRMLFPCAGLGRRSSPTTTRTPTPSPATTRTPPTIRLWGRPSRAQVRELHDGATAVRTCLLPGYNIYTHRQIRLLARPQACKPDKRELTLRRLPRLTSLPGGNSASSS